MYTEFVKRCSSLLFFVTLVCVWVGTEWGGLAVRVFGDKAGLDCAGKVPGLYILNHPGDIDFLTGLIVAYEFNILNVRAYVFICLHHNIESCHLI